MIARPGSLLGRVFLRVGLTMTLAVAALTFFLIAQFRGHVDTLSDRSMQGQAEDIARHLRAGPADELGVDLPPGLAAFYADPVAGAGYVVMDATGKPLTASAGLDRPIDVIRPGAEMALHFFRAVDARTGRQVYGANLPIRRADGELLWIQTFQDSKHDDVLVDTFLDELVDEVGWIVLLIFALILATTYLTIRQGLSPLLEASRQAARIGPECLDVRLGERAMPSEMLPLLRAVNSALDRVEASYHAQRDFTADAAHELRTPIAILKSHIDTLGGGGPVAGLRKDIERVERVVAQLLRLAQADGLLIETGGRADLAAIGRSVAQLMAPAALRSGRDIAVGGPERMMVQGDAGAIEIALRNLVENALAHAPEASEVEIRVTPAPAIEVRDHGPGVPPADRVHIFDRFWRKSRNRSDGAGLGLAIVGRIMTAHGGSVSVSDNAEGGGAVFTLAFDDPARPVRSP